MVHALETIRASLDRSRGLLVDIHPVPTPRHLSVQVDGRCWPAGALVDADKFATYRAADRALDEAVARGLFVPMARQEFTFLVHFDSVDDLREYLSEGELIGDEMDYTSVDDAVLQRVEELLLMPGHTRDMILERPVRIAAFLPADPTAAE